MKHILFLLLLFCFISSCDNNSESSKTEVPASENEDDAARNFIRSVLDQDFEKARTMIIQDSLNNQFLDITEKTFKKMNKEDKSNYKSANIQNYTTRPLNDSVTVAYYTNSFTNKPDSIKLVKRNGQWLVDLKYTFPETKDVLNAQ